MHPTETARSASRSAPAAGSSCSRPATSGCVWTASYGGSCLLRFTPDGDLDAAIDVPAEQVTSVCFGGADRRDLYVVTADNAEETSRAGTIFRTRADVPGVAAPFARI